MPEFHPPTRFNSGASDTISRNTWIPAPILFDGVSIVARRRKAKNCDLLPNEWTED